MWRDPGIPADSFYQVRPECTDVPKTKFKIKESFWDYVCKIELITEIGPTSRVPLTPVIQDFVRKSHQLST